MFGRSAKDGCEERNLETLMGCCQRSRGVRDVGRRGHLKRWEVVSSADRHKGQRGEISGLMLF